MIRVIAVLALAMLAACQREERDTRLDPPVAAALAQYALMPNRIGGATPDVYGALDRPYESSSFNLSEGKRLYEWFNCKGCHADGGGLSGPAFIDGWWHYGPDMVSIVATLREGRPRGMPSYRDKLTDEQMWQLAGYIQTLGAYSARTSAPSRADAMQTRPAENRAPAAATLSDPPSR
jgi:cytochrome c oxidase cbb3-type subunit 3